MAIPKIFSAYELPPDPGLCCEDLSLTQQHFQDECDINLIMERALSTGEEPPVRPTFYGDFSDIYSFQEIHDKIQHAMDEFSSLPAKIRDRFYNNPANLIQFMSNPDNRLEAISLGIIDAPASGRNSSPLDVTVTTDTNTTTNEV